MAGVADPATGRPVTSHTPFYNYSIGKGAASTLAHMLVERRQLEYDTPVVELWPEFGAHGKQAVTMRHVLTHSAGVPGIPLTTTPEDLCDWNGMCSAIAESVLWWEPGTAVGYRLHVRVHRRRGHPPGHRKGDLAGPPGGPVRPAGSTGRALFRHAALGAAAAGPVGGRAEDGGVRNAFSAAGSPDVQSSADDPDAGARSSRPGLLLVGLGLADPLAQDLEEPVGDLRVLLQERLEVPLRDGRQRDIGIRRDGRATALVVEERHLPE